MAFPKTSKFLNSREWRTFLAAASSASYPGVVRAVRAGQAWLTGSAVSGESTAGRVVCPPSERRWLLAESALVTEPGETLGI